MLLHTLLSKQLRPILDFYLLDPIAELEDFSQDDVTEDEDGNLTRTLPLKDLAPVFVKRFPLASNYNPLNVCLALGDTKLEYLL